MLVCLPLSSAVSPLLCCPVWLTVSLSPCWQPETGAECCWVLLCVWVPETWSNIPAIVWWTRSLGGGSGEGLCPHQPRRRRTEGVSEILWWCTCRGRIVITYCKLPFFFNVPEQQPLQHPTSWFQKRFHCLSLKRQTGLMSLALPLFTHRLQASVQVCVRICIRHIEYTLLWKWRERGSFKKKKGGCW